jgi:hypothetical protein
MGAAIAAMSTVQSAWVTMAGTSEWRQAASSPKAAYAGRVASARNGSPDASAAAAAIAAVASAARNPPRRGSRRAWTTPRQNSSSAGATTSASTSAGPVAWGWNRTNISAIGRQRVWLSPPQKVHRKARDPA